MSSECSSEHVRVQGTLRADKKPAAWQKDERQRLRLLRHVFEGDSYLKPRECPCVTENGAGVGGSLTSGFCTRNTERSDLGTSEACSLSVRLSTGSRLDHSPSGCKASQPLGNPTVQPFPLASSPSDFQPVLCSGCWRHGQLGSHWVQKSHSGILKAGGA